MRSEIFGRLLKAGIGSIATYEGKTAPAIEDELGELIGVSAASIQRYKTGHLPPERRTLEILAEACVRRGLLGREWLQKFLYAATYHAPEQLLDKLCPTGPERQRPPRIYENLPAPTYSQFVMRQQAFAEIAEGLTKRSAAVLIVGFGGNGKTSLAREVAARCLAGEEGMPQFDAVVWVSDKDRPGTTNLSVVLDEIARTLDYPGFIQFAHDEKRHEVEQLLRRQGVLVVVDNFETITDGALLSWLLNLPEPSKVLITTREYRREFRRSSWPVDLRGMTEDEARELIAERIRVLKIEKLAGNLAQLEPLLTATGGNPKAIEMTMGLLKYERRPLHEVVDDLYAARGELFDDLFARSWALLDEAARRVLLVLTFFPTSASLEALSATADVQGLAFDRAVERLTDLALIDVQQQDLSRQARYALHPLVRAFGNAKLDEEPAFEEKARERWIDWYVHFVPKSEKESPVYSKLYILEPEEDNFPVLLSWMFDHRCDKRILTIAEVVSRYYHVRGSWEKELDIELIYIEAARKLSDIEGRALSLSYYAQMFGKQGNPISARDSLEELRLLVREHKISADTLFEYHQAIALYYMASDQLIEAQQELEKALELAKDLSPNVYIANLQWLTRCLYLQGQRDEARRLLQEALGFAGEHGIERTTFSHIQLAAIDLDQQNLESASDRLSKANALARENHDRPYTALAQYQFARLHTLRGDLPAARASLAEAIDLFERLGMRRELAEAREEMARLEAQLAAPASP